MATEWPSGEFFDQIDADLAPLKKAYPGGSLHLPEGFDVFEPLTNGFFSAVPWEYHADVELRLRGARQTAPRRIKVIGITLVRLDGEEYRRYVDWAGVWAQLGVSQGRGEVNEDDPDADRTFIDPAGEPYVLWPDNPDQ